jgi:hypothetical protein
MLIYEYIINDENHRDKAMPCLYDNRFHFNIHLKTLNYYYPTVTRCRS